MSRHHYDDFWRGSRRGEMILPVAAMKGYYELPHKGHGRHRTIAAFSRPMSQTIRANVDRRGRELLSAAQMCVMASEAVKRGGVFEITGFLT